MRTTRAQFFWFLVAAAVAAGGTGCASTPGMQRSDGTLQSAGSIPTAPPLAGTWRLVSFESRAPDGEIRYPMGRRVAGQLIYDTNGNVSAHIMDPTRSSFASGDRAAGTDTEVRAAFVGYLAYYGKYTVDDAKGTITHQITGASFPNWVGGSQLRFYTLAGDTLTITTPPIRAGGADLVTALVWQREPAAR